jgi:uncharacterized protein YaaR (DUF327 family)
VQNSHHENIHFYKLVFKELFKENLSKLVIHKASFEMNNNKNATTFVDDPNAAVDPVSDSIPLC